MKSADNKPTLSHAGRRMLLVFAHPDDESFGMGGAIACYAERGVAISLICATNGDVGSVDPEYLAGYESVAALRKAELECAAHTLGIQEVILFGYRDSGMMGSPENNHPECLWQADKDVLVGRIVREMRRIRPHVVVTFDPFGGYGHPDHIVMHRATTHAFHLAGDPAAYPEHFEEGLSPYQPAKLYYTTFPRWPLRLMVWQMRLRGQDPRHMGRNRDLDFQAVLDHLLPVHARISVGRYQRKWDAAAACHASQQSPRQSRSLIDTLTRLIFRHQDFTRAWPDPNGLRRRERDLFEGVE